MIVPILTVVLLTAATLLCLLPCRAKSVGMSAGIWAMTQTSAFLVWGWSLTSGIAWFERQAVEYEVKLWAISRFVIFVGRTFIYAWPIALVAFICYLCLTTAALSMFRSHTPDTPFVPRQMSLTLTVISGVCGAVIAFTVASGIALPFYAF